MAAVWYLGRSNVRIISESAWLSHGIDAEATIWNKSNGWSVPESALTAPQIALLDADDSFATGQADGPRPWYMPVDDETVATRGWVEEKIGLATGGTVGDSAYEIAVANGFTGTELEWLESLQGVPLNLTVGSVTTGATPSVTLTGDSPNQTINFTFPEATGTNLTVGTVDSGPTPGVTITGTAPNKEINVTFPEAGGLSEVDYADLPAYTTLTVSKSGSTWPARPTNRQDIIVQWKGADPSPSIVSSPYSSTAGMYNNIDLRLVTP